MRGITQPLFVSFCTIWALSSPGVAQTLLSGDHSISGNLCSGSDCSGSETFGLSDLKLKSNSVELWFEDTSSGVTPSTDWKLLTNPGASKAFIIRDMDTSHDVMTLRGDAPPSSLYVSSAGNVGLGTSVPITNLHLMDAGVPTIRMESPGSPTLRYDISLGNSSLAFVNAAAWAIPFEISHQAGGQALVIADGGDIGMGTHTPGAPLELFSNDSFNFFRITASGATNDSVDITYTGGPLGTGQLRYNIVDGDNQEMSLDANGNMVLDGTLTTAGPTCSGGCDRVFDADFSLPSIADHAAQMFSRGHLPAIGVSLPNAPVNVTERQGNIINSLEHAHIYIAQQHEIIAHLQSELAQAQSQQVSFDNRLAQIETLLQAAPLQSPE